MSDGQPCASLRRFEVKVDGSIAFELALLPIGAALEP